jgi:hypothetical protein
MNFSFLIRFQVGSGEIAMNEDEWEDIDDPIEQIGVVVTPAATHSSVAGSRHDSPTTMMAARRRNSLICPIYNASIFVV